MKTFLLLSMISLSLGSAVFAQETATAPSATTTATPPAPEGHHGKHKGFHFGVCVGQALAKNGVFLPAWQPGQAPDPAIHAAMQAAKASCRK